MGESNPRFRNPPAMPVSVDLARIELATDRCERSGMPLTYRPASIDTGGQVRMRRITTVLTARTSAAGCERLGMSLPHRPSIHLILPN